ncbi:MULTISPECIES: ABC transporter permease [unclassified Pseudomonas]|uniref:ABC transporter permease n=1 Tax=unclassified Pseudomonas TaxID=196821 RepID=UPI00244CCA34|nr:MULTISPECIES: ABC transporter permease [unclassified Pseudomonas]MDG9929184.1 ABC transporter permease [Pseudomonas sp. GD04042]MDH0484034.1 ABC transporter permease [Pseudomonas sp. GD04015]MDH0605842.1 ABC transporter permease [Pseudomonas sp. GD03869]
MNYREIVLYGVYSDLRTEIARRFLGFLWWIIEPIMYMAVFYVVFGMALRQGGPDYVPFLLCGMIAWKWFDGSVRQASQSIMMNAGLVQQIYVPKSLFALIQIFSNTFKFAIVLLLLLGFLLMTGKSPSLEWLGLLPVILTQLLLIVAVGLLLAAIIPFAHDLKMVVDNLLMLMMFMSGIFFSAEQVPENMRTAFEYNPMVLLISTYRDVLLHNHWPQWSALGYCLALSVPILAVALLILARNERRYPKLLY